MVAVLTSAFVGFASFFLFLGFGYLDPLHAFVTAVLLQFLCWPCTADLAARRKSPRRRACSTTGRGAWRCGGSSW